MSQTDLLHRLLTKAGNAHDLALLYDLHAPSPTPLLTPDEVLAVVRVTSMLGILEGRARKAYDAAKRDHEMRWAKYAEGSDPPMTDEQKAALLADAQSGEES